MADSLPAPREARPPAARALPEGSRGAGRIEAALRRAIVEGRYAYGTRLPAERELAQSFGASRTTVRRALDTLAAARLVTRRVGSGTFVSHLPDPAADDIAEITNPLELVEVRFGVEPHMVRLAVRNATARDLDRLGEALSWLERPGADAADFTRHDQQFHQLLAECTHNPLLIWIYHRINEVRGQAQWRAMRDQILNPARIAEYNRQHRALYQAIRSRDGDSAVGIVTDHLEKAWRDLVGAR